MKLLKGPVWEMGDHGRVTSNEDVVRIKLYGDTAIGEFTVNELCRFLGLKNPDCLRQQFKAWNDLKLFDWNPATGVHTEKKPFPDYFLSSRIPDCYLSPHSVEAGKGIEWGFKKL